MIGLWVALMGNSAWSGVVAGDANGLDEVYRPLRVAVLVGVQDYRDPELKGLRFAEKDAYDLGQVLASEAGGFDRVIVVDGMEATTAKGIEQAISEASAGLQRDDTFVLYLSGHGTLTVDPLEGSQLWFLPSDGELDSPRETGIGVDWLEARVSDLPARRRVLIMDTCHNGRSDSKSAVNEPTASMLRSMRGDPPAPRDLRQVSESEARLFAAQYYQPAMEDPNLENGVYTHFLIQSMTEQREAADLNRDGLVDVTEAHDYARDYTIRHTGGMQVPRAEYRIVGKEEIYLTGEPGARKEAEKALVSACDEVLANGSLIVDGQSRGTLPGLTAIEPGRRNIEVRTADGRSLFRQSVYLQAGHTLPIESLLEQQESHFALLAGPKLRTGPGTDHFHPWAGELELVWVNPFQLPGPFQSDLHIRGASSWGTIPEQGDWSVWSGDAALGLSIGLKMASWRLGPVGELVVPWRHFENDTGLQRQAAVTVGAGLRALWDIDMAAGRLVLRIDSRVIPYVHDGARTHLTHHGLALGWSRR